MTARSFTATVAHGREVRYVTFHSFRRARAVILHFDPETMDINVMGSYSSFFEAKQDLFQIQAAFPDDTFMVTKKVIPTPNGPIREAAAQLQ